MKSLKFLHTSDWHLGKRLFKQERLTEQQDFLQWLVKTGEKQKIDVLIIAGDIFDSPTPPTNALKVYFEFLKQWKRALPNSTVLILAGNHDSGRFLEAPKQWLEEESIHIVGHLEQCKTVTIENSYHFHLLPYFRNSEMYKEFKNFTDFDEKRWEEDEQYPTILLRRYFEQLINPGTNILISHHAFGPFSASPSEQSISFSGQSSIPTETFKELFDYLALGHIHKYQKVNSTPPAYYSGSPLAFRFSESNNKKVIIGDLKEKVFKFTPLDIPQKVELHTINIQGDDYLTQLDQQAENLISLDQKIYLLAKVYLNKPESGINDIIQQKFKDTNITLLSTQLYFNQSQDKQQQIQTELILNKDLDSIFKDYFIFKTGNKDIPTEIMQEFTTLTTKLDIEKDE